MILRVLVGAAAVAIICYVGFFAYERFSAYRSAGRAEQSAWCAANQDDLNRLGRGDPTLTGKSQRVLEYDARQCAEQGF